jgi:hypothetical protein
MHRAMIKAILLAAVSGVLSNPIKLFAEPAPATQPAAQDANVPVKTVMLFSSGVGYFEHTGTVEGSGSTELHFKSQQINDILKSLILQDSGGKVTTVSYASQDPLEKTLAAFQVNIADNPSLGDLLGRIRGAKVKVTVDAEEMEGTILGLEQRDEPGKPDKPIQRWFMNLITGATIRQVELDHVSKLELEDPTLQQELTQALQILAKSRDQDKKGVTMHFEGKGQRSVRIGYVVETPIWKTSYRLILGSEDGKLGDKQPKDSLQGWAIVENQTDNDWNNINLTLVSGRPISFIEDLYQPRYVPRVVLQPAFWGNLSPQTYEDGRLADREKLGVENGNGMNRAAAQAQQSLANGNMAVAGGQPAVPGSLGVQMAEGNGFGSASTTAMDPTTSISAMASTGQLGELFQYTINAVSLPRQQSAMLPIVADTVKVERLSIFNPAVLRLHPLNGARIDNTTGKHLLGGPITVLEAGAYAGDANIDNVPPGQNRLISFGVDLDMSVKTTDKPLANSITTASIFNGVLKLQHKLVTTQQYEAQNKGEKNRRLLIEHPLRPDWNLVDTQKPAEQTSTQYRFEIPVEAGKSAKLEVKEQKLQGEELAIVSANDDQIHYYSANGEVPGSVRDALAKAAKLKAATVDTQRQIDQHNQQLDQITKEQNRIRDNLRTVAEKSDYHNRLLTKLNDQETQIEKLQSQRDDLTATLKQQQNDLDQYLENLTVQ